MEACNLLLSTCVPLISSQPQSLRLAVKPIHSRSWRVNARGLGGGERRLNCKGGGLYTPLKVTSPAGKKLSTLLREKDYEHFESAVESQLRRINDDHEKTMELMSSVDTNHQHQDAELCMSVLQDVKNEIELEVEEAMYMLICRKFFDSGVHMLPTISDCIVEGKLELSTSKDYRQLECIFPPEVLEYVRLYNNQVTGLDADASAKDYWKLKEIDHCDLSMTYAFALIHGRFLKSVSSKYALERLFNDGKETLCSFKSYALSFPPELRHTHSVSKSNEAKNMTNKHLKALFGQVKTRLASTKLVAASAGTLRRIALEGLAFGTFLWDVENYVRNFYKLGDDDSLPIF